MRMPLGGGYATGRTLAGAPTWPSWPGAVRHVQRVAPLKVRRPVSSAGFQLPAAGLSPATALESRTEETNPMYIGEDYGGPISTPPVDPRAARQQLSRIVESALDLLDALDADPDLESAGDELDQARIEWSPYGSLTRHEGAPPQEDDEEGGDVEPLLGWSEGRAGKAMCPTLHDDAEDGGDREPSLAAPERHPFIHGPERRAWGERGGNQSAWATGCANDREEDAGEEPEAVNEDGGNILDEPHDDDDNGIADAAGAWEQLQRRRGGCRNPH